DMFVGYGGAAFVFGKQDVIAEIEGWYSVTSDTPDFWRRDGEPYPMHGGRFTGDPAYFKHVKKATTKLMSKFNLKAQDIDHFVPHQPNPAFPVKVARDIGFKEEQYACSLQVNKIGNTYSGCSPVGLASVLDIAKPDEQILVASYGSGAGSDAYLLRTTKQLLDKRNRQKMNIKYLTANPFVQHIDYITYRRLKLGM
ncbi:MAG TPA: hydroxymethylglutaryl-CoA synthase, partial [Candidatus Nanoarchaeia archaeon]|nr:hydroxymethylglutaryl-CoA synthase [Candidatus Nanoarchaeia archaeon]